MQHRRTRSDESELWETQFAFEMRLSVGHKRMRGLPTDRPASYHHSSVGQSHAVPCAPQRLSSLFVHEAQNLPSPPSLSPFALDKALEEVQRQSHASDDQDLLAASLIFGRRGSGQSNRTDVSAASGKTLYLSPNCSPSQSVRALLIELGLDNEAPSPTASQSPSDEDEDLGEPETKKKADAAAYPLSEEPQQAAHRSIEEIRACSAPMPINPRRSSRLTHSPVRPTGRARQSMQQHSIPARASSYAYEDDFARMVEEAFEYTALESFPVDKELQASRDPAPSWSKAIAAAFFPLASAAARSTSDCDLIASFRQHQEQQARTHARRTATPPRTHESSPTRPPARRGTSVLRNASWWGLARDNLSNRVVADVEDAQDSPWAELLHTLSTLRNEAGLSSPGTTPYGVSLLALASALSRGYVFDGFEGLTDSTTESVAEGDVLRKLRVLGTELISCLDNVRRSAGQVDQMQTPWPQLYREMLVFDTTYTHFCQLLVATHVEAREARKNRRTYLRDARMRQLMTSLGLEPDLSLASPMSTSDVVKFAIEKAIDDDLLTTDSMLAMDPKVFVVVPRLSLLYGITTASLPTQWTLLDDLTSEIGDAELASLFWSEVPAAIFLPRVCRAMTNDAIRQVGSLSPDDTVLLARMLAGHSPDDAKDPNDTLFISARQTVPPHLITLFKTLAGVADAGSQSGRGVRAWARVMSKALKSFATNNASNGREDLALDAIALAAELLHIDIKMRNSLVVSFLLALVSPSQIFQIQSTGSVLLERTGPVLASHRSRSSHTILPRNSTASNTNAPGETERIDERALDSVDELLNDDFDDGEASEWMPIKLNNASLPSSSEPVARSSALRRSLSRFTSVITWYSGHDLLYPACQRHSRWNPTDNSMIAAVTLIWSEKPACGTYLQLRPKGSKKSIVVRTVDYCAGCIPGVPAVDLTKSAFSKLANLNRGRIHDIETRSLGPNYVKKYNRKMIALYGPKQL
ncbi:uncharacterized protein L969DRAFT_95912 [Mixia osmundae IAM 14324]|uniref:RlpA-like protein double-psi beta-barrel domain-containing protein n=1 Tax=Mixia osmundae (strain CBS 9802 / IAM 14324 / JCM 22182 / KY 12970) TaxID=764103 RepID=G7DX21_MIXOS|nr:uncharacterized protein L969DRAFT_95912 [Mixia osmundae IAM 14324]KEI38073.1 hypothetical protein L969DRAFT_95912 [Mixia osmundae IAM 14324]GAA95118.1 hypothetical protein E5Q_01773 [Mixia osmundae IAM 14324]